MFKPNCGNVSHRFAVLQHPFSGPSEFETFGTFSSMVLALPENDNFIGYTKQKQLYTKLATIHKVAVHRRMHLFSVCFHFYDLYIVPVCTLDKIWGVQTLSVICTYTVLRFHPPTQTKTPHSLDRDLGKNTVHSLMVLAKHDGISQNKGMLLQIGKAYRNC